MTVPAPIARFLEHPEILEPKVLVREVSLRFRDIPFVRVRVRIWLDPSGGSDPYFHEMSHRAHTPIQAGPYLSSRNGFATEEIALDQAVKGGLLTWIENAKREGHSPSPSWLVPSSTWGDRDDEE